MSRDSMGDYVASRAPQLAPRRRSRADILADVPAPTTRRRGWSTAQLVAVAVAGALIGLWLSPGRAYADPVPATHVYVSRVDPAPAGPAITVTLSNGRTDVLAPCRYEDGRHCYWQATTAGNGRGRSFVVTRGHVFRVNLSGMALAAGGAR